MRRRDLFFLAGAPLLADQEAEPIRVDVKLVTVAFSVRDAGGKLVSSLTAEDFEIFEDGVPQTIRHFSAGADQPLAVGVVADASGSQEEFLKAHRRDLRQFLDGVMRPRDQAFLLCFGNHLRLAGPWTGSPEKLLEGLRAYEKSKTGREFQTIGPEERRHQGTAFYDAVFHSSEELLGKAEATRRAMVLFSDGEDNSSAHHMLDAIEAAQRAGVTIFGMRYTEVRNGRWTARNKYGKAVMARLAQETGGLDFDTSEPDQLREAFRQVSDILHATYELAYRSSQTQTEPGFRRVQVRARRPGVTIRHKTGYFAR